MARGYKTECPQCGGENLYVTPDNDVSYCFNCGYKRSAEPSENRDGSGGLPFSSNASDLLEIRQFYTESASYYQACLTGSAYKYALARGLTDDTITKYRIGYCPENASSSNTLALRSGLYNSANRPVLADRLVFPYIDPITQAVVDIRGRSLTNEDPKYKGPFGSTGARGADEWPYNGDALLKGSHIITEGEIKTLVASQLGFNCVGLPGISVWRWRLRTMAKGKATVVFDSQKQPGVRESVYQAIDRLAQRLQDLHVATLPLGKLDKMDLDTYLLTKGPDEFRLVLDKALPYNEWAKLLRRPYVLRSGR